MSQDYHLAASRLTKLSPEDRQWLYGQLSSDERASLVELLSLNVDAESDNAVTHQRLESATAEDSVARASPWQITQALIDEPEWILALLFSRRSWPWSAEYWAAMDSATRDRIQTLATSARDSARESAYKAIVHALAQRIERVSSDMEERKTLEFGVARLMKMRPMDD
jgi:hypothetical protein